MQYRNTQRGKNAGDDQASDQAVSLDGMSAPDDRTEANTEVQAPDTTAATDSATLDAADLGERSADSKKEEA